MRWPALVTSGILLGVCGVAFVAVPAAQAGGFVPEQGNDFDCDGLRDLVRFDPAQVDGLEAPGSLIVTYSRTGEFDQINQASTGVPGVPESGDLFGSRHTAYDRDRDGCDELVVGAPDEDLGSLVDAGLVTVIPGSPVGLNTTGSFAYTQDSAGVPGVAEAGDRFGDVLVGGRTNLDVPFLVIGTPYESGPDAGTVRAGVIHYVRPGSVTMIHPGVPGVPGAWEAGDQFGEVIVASDRFFVVGSPRESITVDNAGMVHVFSHQLTNGRPTPIAGLHQDTPGVSGVAEADRFGASLSALSYRPATGSQVGAVVAIGSPDESDEAHLAGMAHLVFVSPTGQVSTLAAVDEATPGVSDEPEEPDDMGSDVVLANRDPDSLVATPLTTVWAVAVGDENTDGDEPVGAIHVFPPGWQPGQPDIYVRPATIEQISLSAARLRASHTNLSIAEGGICIVVPWRNLLEGAAHPIVTRPTGSFDDCP